MSYFDPEYEKETVKNAPVVNAGKHVFYRDVYVFVDRLKDLAVQHDDAAVKNVITACFRGSAIMWYFMELIDLKRQLLRDVELNKWYITLINRFKIRTSTALAHLTISSSFYSLTELKQGTSSRAWIQQMLHFTKIVEITFMHNQLSLVWNRLHYTLRRDISESTSHTSLTQFLDHIDSKTSIWHEMITRKQFYTFYNRQDSYNSSRRQQEASKNNMQYSSRVSIGSKSSAYLADVMSEGYDVYEEENLQQQKEVDYTGT